MNNTLYHELLAEEKRLTELLDKVKALRLFYEEKVPNYLPQGSYKIGTRVRPLTDVQLDMGVSVKAFSKLWPTTYNDKLNANELFYVALYNIKEGTRDDILKEVLRLDSRYGVEEKAEKAAKNALSILYQVEKAIYPINPDKKRAEQYVWRIKINSNENIETIPGRVR